MKTEFKRRAELLESEDYHPEALIDLVKKKLGLKRDYELVSIIGFDASVISKVKNKRKLLSAELLLALHDSTGLSIKEMKKIMGIPNATKSAAITDETGSKYRS